VTPTRRPHASVVRTTAEGQAAHKPHEYWAFRRPNAQVQRRRSTAGAQGTNTGHENAEGMACVGVRLTAQLGAELGSWIGLLGVFVMRGLKEFFE